jgi:uncharacterized membrane protein
MFLFLTGAIFGWCLELVYRRYFGKAKKWINPGFLSGPYLPLYGFGICILYIISDLNVSFVIKLLCFCIGMTFIELDTGIIFLKYFRIRLWDYSKCFLNYKGLICPLYSIFWTILSLAFYFLIYPYFYDKIEYLYQHLEFSLFIGFFYGIIIVDVFNSFNIASKIKQVMEETEKYVDFDNLKYELKTKLESMKHIVPKPNFILPFKNTDIMEHLHFRKDKYKQIK